MNHAPNAPPLLPTWFRQNALEVDLDIATVCSRAGALAPLLVDATRHGRKLRSCLSIQLLHWLGWQISNDRRRNLLRDLARVEVLHAASCILDDVIDGDKVRRGIPVFHVRNGLPQAILTALSMLTLAFHSDSAEEATTQDLIHATHETVLGEAWDTFLGAATPGSSPDVAIRAYLAKTTPYFALAHELVARHCARDDADRAAARNYGHFLGAFYQAANDYYDWFHIPPSVRGQANNNVLLTFSIPLALLARKTGTYHALLGTSVPRRELSVLADLMRSEGVDSDTSMLVANFRAQALAFFPSNSIPHDLASFLGAVDSPLFWSYSYATQ